MEMELQGLIDKIKSDGVATAEKEASRKIEEAKLSAEKLLNDAKEEQGRLLTQAKEENERLVKASEDAIRQAGRNQLISFRDSVTKELDAVVKSTVEQSFSKENLLSLIPKVVEAWAKNPQMDKLEVLLNSEDLKAVETALLGELKSRLLSGVELKADENIGSGFRIAAKDGTAYYDYSADAVAELLSKYLNPRIAGLMKEASKA